MALIDIRCAACGSVSEVYRAAPDHPWTPPCPKCDATATEQIHLPRGTYASAPAVVVYQAPDGTFRYPGDAETLTTQHYDRLGYRRIEARGWAEVRTLEGRLNAEQAQAMRQHVERECAFHEQAERARRGEVFHGLANSFSIPDVAPNGRGELVYTGRVRTVKLGPEARDLLRAAMARNDSKPRPQYREPGVVVEAYSYDRSNREDARGSDGRRRRD
jgi:hypothetical protein